jgi:polar amino acid transport system substrate-binding protein
MVRPALTLLQLAVAIAVLLAIEQPLYAQKTPDARVADLVTAGKVRAGVGVVAPHWAVKDAKTGELHGVAVDVARAFAARLGVELIIVPYPSPPSVLEGVKSNAWDIGFLASDASRATVVDFSQPYLQIDATYLVPDGSSIRNVADADQPGVRIAVTTKSVEEIVLSKLLKHAELRAVSTIGAGLELVRNGTADVLAAPRPALIQSAAKFPGFRVLDDRFHAAFAAMAVPKGNAERLSYINEFLAGAKSSGLIQQAIEHAGVKGVEVSQVSGSTAR